MTNTDFGNKVLKKKHAHEKVGVLALRNGKPAVVEYTELGKELAELTVDNELVFNAANIAIHCFSMDFLQKMADRELVYHVASKRIPVLDGPREGRKMEMFIFDSLEYSENPCAYFVPRQGNFSPLKNAPNEGNDDSPETARRDLSQFHISLVEKYGGIVENKESAELMEISPLLSYNGEGLRSLVSGKIFKLPCHLSSALE